jgi:hypothetical protein
MRHGRIFFQWLSLDYLFQNIPALASSTSKIYIFEVTVGVPAVAVSNSNYNWL